MRKSHLQSNISDKAVGTRLQQLRRESGYSQVDIANKIGVSRSCIANWEHGYRTPDCFNVKQLCRIYKVPVDFVYGTSTHKYNVKIPDYFEIDFTRLNDNGMIMLYDYYKYLAGNEKYSAD